MKIKLKRVSIGVNLDAEMTIEQKDKLKSQIREYVEKCIDVNIMSLNTMYEEIPSDTIKTTKSL